MPAKDAYVQTWRALERLHAEGRVRAIAVSKSTLACLRRLVRETEVVPAVNQIELHPGFQQAELRAVNAELGIVTQAYGRTAAQIVLRWHLQLGNVVIPKSVTPSRIEENFGSEKFR